MLNMVKFTSHDAAFAVATVAISTCCGQAVHHRQGSAMARAVPQQTDAEGFCLCQRPCLYVVKTSGCRNGDACHFCHQQHHPKRPFDRPSLKVRNKLKGIVEDFIAKGADLRILWALANRRPYLARLLAQYLGAPPPDYSDGRALHTAAHWEGHFDGTKDDAHSDPDPDWDVYQEFLTKLEEAEMSRS